MISSKNELITRFIPPITNNGYNEAFIMENCIVDNIDLCSARFNERIIIKNCIIRKIELSGTFFEQGLDFSNNVVQCYIIFEAGGHNNQSISFINNIFNSFFCFFDCYFPEKVVVKGNIFINGSDLLTKEDPNIDNVFGNGYVVDCNLGSLDTPPEVSQKLLTEAAKKDRSVLKI